ncbi:hypothetical protein ACTFIW_003860 [Dictyostelium discoideum]
MSSMLRHSHSQRLTLAKGYWDQSYPHSLRLQVRDFSLVSSSRPMEWKSVCSQVTTMFQWSTTESNMSSNLREILALLMTYQALLISGKKWLYILTDLERRELTDAALYFGDHRLVNDLTKWNIPHKAAYIQKYGYLFQEILISLENNLERDREKLHTIQNFCKKNRKKLLGDTATIHDFGQKIISDLAVALTEIRKNSLNILYIIDH